MVKRIINQDTGIVAPNKNFALTIGSIGTIYDFLLEFTQEDGSASTWGNVKSSIKEIRLEIGGEVKVKVSPENLHALYQTLGNEAYQAGDSNVLSLNCMRLLYKNPVLEDIFAIGTDNYGGLVRPNIVIWIECNATTTGVGMVRAKVVRSDFGAGKNITKGVIRVLTHPETFATTGKCEVTKLPKNPKERYLLVQSVMKGGTITHGECTVNNQDIFQESSKASMDRILNQRGYKGLTDRITYMFTDGAANGNEDLPMQGVDDFRIKDTFSVAPTNGAYEHITVTTQFL